MKAFQIRLSVILVISFSLLGSSTLISNSSAQEGGQIPNWVKNVAGWWGNGDISENEFLTAIEYLINNNIIALDFIPCYSEDIAKIISASSMVPSWVKNNAKWWSEDLIDDKDFVNGLQYLIKNQIIFLDNKKIQGEVPVEDVLFSDVWTVPIGDLAFSDSSLFEIYGVYGNCILADEGYPVWETLLLGLNPNKMDMYNEFAVWNDPQKSVVVYPYFTSMAYAEPGFYTYYRGECDECTTTKFTPPSPKYTASGIGHQALSLLGYSTITDIEIDREPRILTQFDKVIMLHNEYVTRTMFDAITSHPNVIYLYPNALYAEIEVDYIDQTITLIRGHNYPESHIHNGFDWEFDNTHPYEYDSDCASMDFYKIPNGWMTNCYPENLFLRNTQQVVDVLKTIKGL